MANTNKMEVLFEELRDEQIASISGGTSTATVVISGNSVTAKALVSNIAPTVTTNNPSPTSVFNITPFVNSSPSVVQTYKLDNGNGVLITLSIQ